MNSFPPYKVSNKDAKRYQLISEALSLEEVVVIFKKCPCRYPVTHSKDSIRAIRRAKAILCSEDKLENRDIYSSIRGPSLCENNNNQEN